jgi:hypothetical protein
MVIFCLPWFSGFRYLYHAVTVLFWPHSHKLSISITQSLLYPEISCWLHEVLVLGRSPDIRFYYSGIEELIMFLAQHLLQIYVVTGRPPCMKSNKMNNLLFLFLSPYVSANQTSCVLIEIRELLHSAVLLTQCPPFRVWPVSNNGMRRYWVVRRLIQISDLTIHRTQ